MRMYGPSQEKEAVQKLFSWLYCHSFIFCNKDRIEGRKKKINRASAIHGIPSTYWHTYKENPRGEKREKAGKIGEEIIVAANLKWDEEH